MDLLTEKLEKEIELREKREYLEQIINIDGRIHNIIDSIHRIENDCYYYTNPKYTDVKVQNSLNRTAFEDAVLRLETTRKKLKEEMNNLIRLKVEIYQVIEAVRDNECRNCLRWLYINNNTLSSYAYEFNYSQRNAYRKRDKAIMCIQIPNK